MDDENIAEITGDLRDALLPVEYRSHPLVRERHFFTLPIELLQGVVEQVGEEQFPPDLLKLERALSRESGDHSARIGFHDDRPIEYDLLFEPLGTRAAAVEEDRAGSPNWSVTNAANSESRVAWIRQANRGYAGWLSINPAFNAEQAACFDRWRREIRVRGLCRSSATTNELDFAVARHAFCARWNLSGLAGPFLPSPATPQLPLRPSNVSEVMKALAAVTPLATAAGPAQVTFAWPQHLPLPPAQPLRDMLEDCFTRQNAPEHLREWVELVRADNTGKKAIPGLARLFVLQHFWRVLFARHAATLKGKVGAVRYAFASFLFPLTDGPQTSAKVETLRKDLSQLSGARGGADWFTKPCPYDDL